MNDEISKETRQKVIDQLMGLSDVAKVFGWTNGKTSMYNKRGTIPKPVGEIGGRPVWWKDDVLEYKKTLEGKSESEH